MNTSTLSVPTLALAFSIALYAGASLLSMATMSIGAALVGVCVLFWSLGKSKKFFRSEVVSRYRWVSMLLAGACVASLLGLEFTPIQVEGFDLVRVEWSRDLAKLWYFVWGPALAFALTALNEQQERRVWKVWLGVFAVISVVGCVQFFSGWPRAQGIPGLDGRYHATLFLGHHLSTASVWIFPFFAVLAAIFSKPIRDHWGISQKILVVSGSLGLLVLFLSFSRMLWLALPVGIGFFGLVFRRGLRLGQVLFVSVALILSVSAAWQVPQIRERMQSSMGTHERFELWKVNWRFFLDRPLTGAGWHHNLELAGQSLRKAKPEGSVFIGHAHNNAIDVVGSMGILGLMTWLAWNIWLAVELIRLGFSSGVAPWIRDLSRGWLAAFLVFQLNGLTQVNFWEGKVQHQLFWMVAWVLVWRYRQESQGHVKGAA